MENLKRQGPRFAEATLVKRFFFLPFSRPPLTVSDPLRNSPPILAGADVDDQLIATGHVQQGALLGHDGSTWAASGVTVSGAEGAALAGLFANPDNAYTAGVTLGGDHYKVIRADDRSIYCKTPEGGAACVKTNQAVIVGIYSGDTQPGQCTTVVEKLADYLSTTFFCF